MDTLKKKSVVDVHRKLILFAMNTSYLSPFLLWWSSRSLMGDKHSDAAYYTYLFIFDCIFIILTDYFLLSTGRFVKLTAKKVVVGVVFYCLFSF